MKKIFILSLFACLFMCGCTTLHDMTIEEVVNNETKNSIEVYNKYRKGYKYNLPKGLQSRDSSDYNETLVSKDYKYYLYVDAVSYHNKVIEKYETNKKSYVSMAIDYEDKFGYLEINKVKDNNYLVEIMYNYAKIEVIVKSEDINVVVANALSILTSIKFNDNILDTLLNEETSQFREYEFNIFETTTTESEYLESMENDVYEEEEIHDSDLIN